MRARSLLPLALLVAAGCSSKDDDGAAAAPASTAYVAPPACSAPDPATDRDACKFAAGAAPTDSLGACAAPAQLPVDHVILVMQENRSFDHLLGHLKGNGQDDVDVPDESKAASPVDPADLSKGTVAWQREKDLCFEDTNHEWDGTHLEWNGGKNDGFPKANASKSDPTGSRAMGYYDQTELPFTYALASTFATSDRYFCAVLGPTWPNREYFYAASSFGMVSNDAPPTGMRTIFHALNDAGVSWKIYKSDTPGAASFVDMAFQPWFRDHLASIADFATDAAANQLPQVAWLDPIFASEGATNTSEHPAGDVQVGEKWIRDQVMALMQSPSWPTSVMFITYDEHGGQWDHVAPPRACAPDDRAPQKLPELGGFDQYGFRVPVYVVSPFAKKHFVSHQTHSHTSILRFVEARFGLPALSGRDANSDAMLDMLDFQSPPFFTPPDLPDQPVDQAKLSACQAAFPK